MASPLARSIAALIVLAPVLAPAAPQPPAIAEAMLLGYQSSDPQVLAGAAVVLETQLQAEPGNDEVRRALGILYLDRLKNPARALPHLEKIVADAPEDSAWQQSLARTLRALEQRERAAEHYRQAAELQPGDAWARYELGNTLAESGQYPAAIDAYRSALERDGKSVEVRLALARTLWAGGQIDEAQRVARAVLGDEPLNSSARKLLATNSEPPQPPPAPAAAPVVRARPKPVSPVDAAIAEAYRTRRREAFERAARVLEAHLRQEPRDLPRRRTVAYLYLDNLHAPEQAVPHLARVVAAAPRDAAWLQLLAKAQLATGDRAGAAASYRRAADVAPRDVWARYHLGCTLRDLGQTAEAEGAFRAALALEPRNVYVRRELARLAQGGGRSREAAALARELIRDDARDAEAQAILGDVYRADRDFAAAGSAYQAALASNPAHPLAAAGLREIRRAQRPEVKLAFYTFDDTDGLRQTGIFSHVGALLTGRLRASASLNERFFKQSPGETVERFEAGLGGEYRFSGALQLAAGISQFKTENLGRETGANVALYFAPTRAVDLSVAYRYAEPVNDSYITARDAFTQNILSASLSVRPLRSLAASVTASTADYSDGNTRRAALASLAWYAPLPASPVVRLEYEWLDFAERTPAYSSPENYGRFRPVLEFAPRLTDWLKLEFHGELSYVFDEREWGTGITAGPRFNVGDWFDLGFNYMRYEIPGGQSTWSGEGFKIEFAGLF